jgi:hypothetical protein
MPNASHHGTSDLQSPTPEHTRQPPAQQGSAPPGVNGNVENHDQAGIISSGGGAGNRSTTATVTMLDNYLGDASEAEKRSWENVGTRDG